MPGSPNAKDGADSGLVTRNGALLVQIRPFAVLILARLPQSRLLRMCRESQFGSFT
jgi:hypothetical protein